MSDLDQVPEPTAQGIAIAQAGNDWSKRWKELVEGVQDPDARQAALERLRDELQNNWDQAKEGAGHAWEGARDFLGIAPEDKGFHVMRADTSSLTPAPGNSVDEVHAALEAAGTPLGPGDVVVGPDQASQLVSPIDVGGSYWLSLPPEALVLLGASVAVGYLTVRAINGYMDSPSEPSFVFRDYAAPGTRFYPPEYYAQER